MGILLRYAKVGETEAFVLINMTPEAVSPLRQPQVAPAATAYASALYGQSCALYRQHRQAEQALHMHQGLAFTKCWEYGTATGGSMPFTWLKSDIKNVQGRKKNRDSEGQSNRLRSATQIAY
jgi:hypothetical protein